MNRIAILTFSIVFLISAVMALANTAKVVDSTLSAYVFHLEDEYCDYYNPRPLPVEEETEKTPCEVNYTRANREIIRGASWLMVSLPVSVFTFRRINSLLKEP